MSSERLNLKRYYHNAVRFWWLFFICVLIGSLIGIILASVRQPVYEASATLLITIDRSRSVVKDDITVVQATDRVRALILSDLTLQEALENLSGSDYGMGGFDSIASFRKALRIAQQPASFELLVYANKPELAAEGANAWLKASLAALDEAYLHAVRAAELQNVLYEANCTLTLQVDDSQEQAVWLCTSGRGEAAENLPEEILEEVKASRGILPFYSFAPGEEAQPSHNPILWARSGFIISGMIVGLLVGIVVILVVSSKNQLR